MKLEKDMEYKEFLEVIKNLTNDSKINPYRKYRIVNCIDFLVEVDNKELQDFIVNATAKINSFVKREFNSKIPIEYNKLYEPACCLFELTRDRFDKIKDFSSKQIASICYYSWMFNKEQLNEYGVFLFDKNLCKEILNKYPKDGLMQSKAYSLVRKDYDEFGNYEGFIQNNIQKIKEIDKEELCRIINDDNLGITLPF